MYDHSHIYIYYVHFLSKHYSDVIIENVDLDNYWKSKTANTIT